MASHPAGAGAGPVPTVGAPTTGCKKTKGPGYALVIAYHIDAKTKTKTFFIAHESRYIEYPKVDAAGNPVYEKGKQKMSTFRKFPSTATTDSAKLSVVNQDPDFRAYTKSHYVIRGAGFTVQIADATTPWGFPKGAGQTDAEPSKDIAIREFEEEVGYRLNPSKLLYKRCLHVSFKEELEVIVYHYEVTDTEKKAIESAYSVKQSKREGESFEGMFMTEAAIQKLRKNKHSTSAFSSFATDNATLISQTNIPKGGVVNTSVTPPKTTTATTTAAAKKTPPGGGGYRRFSRVRSRKTKRKTRK